MTDLEVIYADKDIIVINKPPLIPVHGGLSVWGATIVDFLLKKFPEIKNVGDPSTDSGQANLRPGIVHRLDKNTSGVMVVARNQNSFQVLKNLFQKRLVEKTYWAIVCGCPQEKKGTITLPMGRLVKNPLKRGVEKDGAKIRGAREAVTDYKVIRRGETFSLLELTPRTGRMHQLRVHLKALGHPVACDTIYGGKKVCCPPGANRQLLHAKSISFSFPEGRKLCFETDPPEDFLALTF